jgi:hypothetical protein
MHISICSTFTAIYVDFIFTVPQHENRNYDKCLNAVVVFFSTRYSDIARNFKYEKDFIK